MGSGFAVAMLVGVGIGVQVAIIGRSSATTSPLAVSFALQLAGSAAAVLWATRHGAWTDVVAVARQWWWIPLGIVGWVIVAGLAYASRQAGAAAALSVAVASQLTTGLVFDAAMNVRHIGPRHALGILLIAAGVVIMTMSGDASGNDASSR